MSVRNVFSGKCEDLLRGFPDNFFDSVVTDPPYGLSFMGNHWDYDVPTPGQWREILRVLKPGGHLLSFGGTRTYHRLTSAIEDGGFEIRDMISWVYGSGFPKSLNVSKAMSKRYPYRPQIKEFQGWGTALKPACEPICLARKPFSKNSSTVAANVLAHRTGALNIDGCRVGCGIESRGRDGEVSADRRYTAEGNTNFAALPGVRGGDPNGRYPANFVHDGSDEVCALFPHSTSGAMKTGLERSASVEAARVCYSKFGVNTTQTDVLASSGSASRFFYCAKASKSDREEGLSKFLARPAGIKNSSGRGFSEGDCYAEILRRNHHPTVKPTSLMRWLVRLVTPPGGVVLDPFCGSGSTGKACCYEGFHFCGIDLNPATDKQGEPLVPRYTQIARARIAWAEDHHARETAQGHLFEKLSKNTDPNPQPEEKKNSDHQ